MKNIVCNTFVAVPMYRWHCWYMHMNFRTVSAGCNYLSLPLIPASGTTLLIFMPWDRIAGPDASVISTPVEADNTWHQWVYHRPNLWSKSSVGAYVMIHGSTFFSVYLKSLDDHCFLCHIWSICIEPERLSYWQLLVHLELTWRYFRFCILYLRNFGCDNITLRQFAV